jgi:LmbE family N-acetylglucosaminyl deacetylase
MMRLLPDLPAGRPPHVLCLGAHCDDIEIGCGGTVLRLLSEHPGASVRWVVFASDPEREREARACAEALLAGAGDVAVEVHAFRDAYLPQQWAELKEEFEKLKLDCSPDLVLTHAGGDAHQDHRVVSELTWNTFRDHLVLEYEIPKYDGDLGRPNVYVPVTRAHVRGKVEALEEHYASQRGKHWFDAELFRGLMRVRGMECGAPERYAEAFHARKITL